MLGLFASVPTPTDVVSNSSAWSNTFIPEFMIYVYIGVGILVAVGLILFLIRTFHGAMAHLGIKIRYEGREWEMGHEWPESNKRWLKKHPNSWD